MIDKPTRIQLRRTKGWRKPDNTIVVTRRSKHWGNQFVIGDKGTPNAKTAVAQFSEWLNGDSIGARLQRGRIMSELRDKNLACTCRLDQPCHADVLLEIANREPE